MDSQKTHVASSEYLSSEIRHPVDNAVTHVLQQRKRARSPSQARETSHANRKKKRKKENYPLQKELKNKKVNSRTAHVRREKERQEEN